MPVIVDAMGGDHAPREIVEGAIQAAREFGIEIILVGHRDALAPFDLTGLPITIEHAEQTIGFDEHALKAVRKKPDASIPVAARLAASIPGSALVSAGHTGAVMAAALMALGKAPGVERPAVAALIPTLKGDVVVLDVGANVDCRPSHLVQFAQMGAAYARHVLGIERPRVGLLNIGSEDSKGNELTLASHAALREAPITFVGNIEGDHLFDGEVDVVVTDGFVGNVFLKTSEGISRLITSVIGDVAGEMGEGAAALMPLLGRLERFRTSNPVYAGAPLLGVKGPCLITHGSSKARTMKHAIHLAQKFASSDAVKVIEQIGEGGLAGAR